MMSAWDFSAVTIDGRQQDLADYRGRVLLVVNVASECGFTGQYTGLEQLWRRYREDGLVVLGFPCNQFGGQEPGTEGEIARFCSSRYQVSFPLFAKVDVNGPDAHPLWAWLRHAKGGLLGEDIRWNFTKFVVGRDGQVRARAGPATQPEQLAGEIEAALSAGEQPDPR